MENQSPSSDVDALPSGGLAGAIDRGIDIEGQPVVESAATNITQNVEKQEEEEEEQEEEEEEGGIPEEIKDMMDLDIALPSQPEEEGEKRSASTPPLPTMSDPLSSDNPGVPPPDRAMTTTPQPPPPPPPPPPPRPPLATAAPALTPQQQTPRDLQQILQAAGSIHTHFPNRGSVPPSPVVKPGALHEFEVSDPTSPATRRRSSATAGIAGLEELRNRIDAEEGGTNFKRPRMDLDGGFRVGPLDQLIQATAANGGNELHASGFSDAASQPRAHVIDAFVRLDFDDGHVFYVRNSSVIFGRAEGASSNSFQQVGPDGSTVIGSNPFGGFDPTTTPGTMSMKREKKKRRKKKGDGSTTTKKSKSTTSGASSTGPTGRQTLPMFRDSFSANPYPFGQAERVDEVPIIHLPLANADADSAAQPPKKNISRRHAVLNYNFAKRRFELKITGKNGAFVEDEFVHCDTTWVVGPGGMRVQIGGVGFKVVVPQVPGGGFEVDAAPMSVPGRGKGGKGMSMGFNGEYGNGVSDDEDEMEQGDGSRDSDESMDGESEEEGSGDEEDDDDDEEAQEGDVENSEDESEESESESEEEVEASPPPPEPVKVEKKRGRGRPRKDEAEIARQELEKANVKEKAKEKERRHREKLEVARRAKEAEREKERERKRLEEVRQKEERAKQKERARREKEQQKEQKKKLNLPSKEEPKKSKLYLPTPAKKGGADKSLTSQTKKGPGRPPKAKPPSSPPPQQVHESLVEATSLSPSTPELAQEFSPSDPLMAVAAFNANTPAIDPALYGSTSYAATSMQHQTLQTETKPAREPKPKKEKSPVKKRTPSPEINEADYPPEALLKPAASYVILIHEAISNSAEKALTLPQIYKAIERKYPYFKLRVTTTGWQSSVRHNLGAHKAFCKVTRSGKGWMWGINEGVSIEKEKNKANIAASRPPAYQPPMPPGYQNGTSGYHPQAPNGYPAHSMGVPAYAENQTGASTRLQQPMYPPSATPQYQLARIPPMPMPYQPPSQQTAPPPVTSKPLPQQEFPNAPIPPPAGKPESPQLAQNVFSPETLAAIQVLQKQLAVLTGQGTAPLPTGVSPVILSQAQQVLTGLMSGKLTGRGFGGGVDLVKQLSKVLVPVVKSAAVSPTPAPVSQPSSSLQAPQKTPVDYKNLPPEKKKQLYLALLAAKEKKEKELREAGAAAAGVKRPLGDGAGPVAKKIDVGSGGGGSAG